MTPLIFALLAVAGGVGATARYVLDGALRRRVPAGYPWATTIINVSGSAALGFLTGLAMDSAVPAGVSAVLGAGFLGGYTTFSTASYETVQLVRDRRYAAALGNGAGMAAGTVAVAALGLWLGLSL
jgi:CrcB protein